MVDIAGAFAIAVLAGVVVSVSVASAYSRYGDAQADPIGTSLFALATALITSVFVFAGVLWIW